MEQQKTKESKKRYFAYDLMRAAAMLLIVFYHTILSFAKQNSVASAKLVSQRSLYHIFHWRISLFSAFEKKQLFG